MDNPIINSLLDLDFYKLTMGQVQWHNYRDVHVEFGFTNRTRSVRLAEAIPMDELTRQLDHVRTLRFQDDELHYLLGIDCGDRTMFAPAYVDFLAQLQLPPYRIDVDNGQFKLRFPGLWPQVTDWETIALSIVNELYYTSTLPADAYEQAFVEGRKRLMQKIQRIRTECPHIKFSDFGTRRRFAGAWQDEVVRTLMRELPDNFLGTSCVDIARRRGVKPMGTSAHEMYMVMAALAPAENDELLRASHNRVLQDWWASYGRELSIALTDTFGSGFFFHDMTRQQAQKWKGLRHDSDDPIVFGERAIEFYWGYHIDPVTKLLVFSDGLDLDTIIRIDQYFMGRIMSTFGWGTNLTNDMGLKPLSLVVKVMMANGRSAVKLSDNLAKSTGPEDEVARYKRVFKHTGTLNKACVY